MIFKLLWLTLAASALTTTEAYSQAPAPARPASAAGLTSGSTAAAQTLTAAELATVKATLAPYKPDTLTADHAKLIKRTLRDAGLRRSPALDAALSSAGFSPAKLDQLDPPPPRPADGSAPPPPPPLQKK